MIPLPLDLVAANVSPFHLSPSITQSRLTSAAAVHGAKARTLVPGILTLACLLAVPVTAQVNYEVSGGTAYVTLSPNASGNIVIASTYNGYPVTAIGGSAFYRCTNLMSVTIPDSVTAIGGEGFRDCTSLTSVNIPNGVTYIGGEVFLDCRSLTSVNIPNGVTYIGGEAFRDCRSLTSVNIPNSVTYIEDDAFHDCASLTSVNIPNSVTRVGDEAFSGCSSLTSLTIGNSVTHLGYKAFFSCASLTSVTIPNSVISIGAGAFSGYTSLTNLTVDPANSRYSSPDGVLFDQAQTTLISFPAGRGGSYVIPNSVTYLGDWAFSGCTSLTNVTIPDSVTSIGRDSFSFCTSLTSVTIGNSVTSLGYRAFLSCISLTSVTIPDSVTSIWGEAFYGCTSLTNLTVDSANSSYSSLDGVLFDQAQTTLLIFPASRGGSYVIPTSVNYIRSDAFSGCTTLKSVTIPNSVTSFESGTFSGCTSLTNLTVDPANSRYSSFDGVLFDKAQTILITFPAGRGGSYVIPNSVTYLWDMAFNNCGSLMSVTIPNSVTFVQSSQFYGCTNLTNLTFQGNSPPDLPWFDPVLQNVGAGATVYYYCGTTGWGPTYGGLPTVMLVVPQIGPGSAGVKPGGFGFTLTCLTNQTIVVEASTNLATWQPIWTNSLSDTFADFVDPQWLNQPHRFYRARSN